MEKISMMKKINEEDTKKINEEDTKKINEEDSHWHGQDTKFPLNRISTAQHNTIIITNDGDIISKKKENHC